MTEMSDEPNRVRSFVEVWARRVLTISGCVLIWLVLLAAFPLLLIAGATIDLARGGVWVITRCVLFFPFYFSCEVFGIIASFFLLGGPLNLLDQNEAADVVFCAHFGFDGVVDLRDFLRGSLVGVVVKVRFWRVPFAAVPATRDARKEWLFENWMRVDEWVGRQKANEVVAARAD